MLGRSSFGDPFVGADDPGGAGGGGSQSSNPPKKKWSPVDRMLAAKQQNGRRKSRRSTAEGTKLPSLPNGRQRTLDEVPVPPPPPPLPPNHGQVSVACQTLPSFDTLVLERTLPERQKADREIRRLQQRLKELELAAAEGAADRAREAAKAQLDQEQQAQRLLAEERARREAAEADALAARAELTELQARLQEELEDAKKARDQDRSYLRSALEQERTKTKTLSTHADGLQGELRKITEERDSLLVRLETEQEELMSRVQVLQQRMSASSSPLQGALELEAQMQRQMQMVNRISAETQAVAERQALSSFGRQGSSATAREA